MKRSSLDDIEMSSREQMKRMPFLSAGRSLGQRFYNYGRHFRTIILFVTFGLVIVWVVDTWGDALLDWSHEEKEDALTPLTDIGQALHILVPATHSGVNLCKTMMGLSILGYANPVLLGWKGAKSEDGMQNQIPAKITGALNYVKNIEKDDDIVVMVDGYDSWFQLPPKLLRARYFRLIEAADYRMRRRLGRRAVRREAMKQTVVFGAGKVCTPNQLSSVACYPIPEAPTPRDMYGNNTDTIMGRDKHSSYRPRYLDAGFMMGPVSDVRRILERAQELVETLPTANILDNGNPDQSPTNLYGGNAQGVFSRIFGEQAFQREIIRQRYRSWFKKWSLPHTPGSIEGHEFKDITNPDFTHEEMSPMKGHPREYGINLDFRGSLVGNTAHSLGDFRFRHLDTPDQQRWDDSILGRNSFDCKIRLSSVVPEDLTKERWPESVGGGDPNKWISTQLFGNLCLGNIPVVVHHNDQDKGFLERAWPDLWYQPLARQALDKIPNAPEDIGEGETAKGAFTDQRDWLTWDDLCPAEYNQELFRS